MKLSVVTTLYNSEETIQEFYERIVVAAEELPNELELIFVVDGPTDRGEEIIREIATKDKRVRVVVLSRNFGHHHAIMEGLRRSTGGLVFLIDSDLEESPEELLEFNRELQANKVDVVYGVQMKRGGGIGRRLSGDVFASLFNALSEVEIAKNPCVIRLMTRRYVDALISFRERELVFVGICCLAGFRQMAIPIDKGWKGSSNYSFNKKVALALNYIVCFSKRPLELMFILGSGISVVSLLAGGVLVCLKMLSYAVIPGWTGIVVSIWFLVGCVLLSNGLLGLYVSRIFTEVKARPASIVAELINFE